MKKFLIGLVPAFGTLATFAEEGADAGGGAANTIIDVADVTSIFTGAQTSMASLIDAALPVVIAFVGGGLIIWGALALISLVKRGFVAGKGR